MSKHTLVALSSAATGIALASGTASIDLISPVPAAKLAPARRAGASVKALVALLALALGLGACAAVAGPSVAAEPPALSLGECFGDGGHGSCHSAGHRSLELADDVAASPDGHSVYVVAEDRELPSLGANAITEFTRAPDGRLRPRGCLTFKGARGCRRADMPLRGADRLALSPDGHDLYVAWAEGITEFARSPGGELKAIGCLTAVIRAGVRDCDWLGAGRESGPEDVIVSPDGRSVYVSAGEWQQRGAREVRLSWLLEFHRRPDGTLAPIGCVSTDAGGGCTRAPGAYYGDLAVTPDGSRLYAVGVDSVTELRRRPDGRLVEASCQASGGAGGCGATYPQESEPEDKTVAISADGSRLYLGGLKEVGEFAIDPDGSLSRLSAVAVAATRLLPSSDGSRLYGTDGFVLSVLEAGEGGLRAAPGGNYRDEGGVGIALSPDGSQLYAASFQHSSLLVLDTDLTQPPE